MIQLKDEAAYKLAEEQLDQFLKDTDYMPFEYDDFANWQKKAYKERKIEFVYAWWIIRDVMKIKYDHYIHVDRVDLYMSPQEVLNELNSEYKEPKYFYNEDTDEYYYYENVTTYYVKGKKEEENEPEEEEAGTTGVGDTEGRLS